MRQQSQQTPQSHSLNTVDSNQARKQRINKKRAIRKNKINGFSEQASPIIYAEKPLTKQQKILIQKAKNREAAQKSRDQHKQYVQSLQKEIKQLKQLLEQPKYCIKCLGLIQSQPQLSYQKTNFDFDNFNDFGSLIQNSNVQEYQDQNSVFVRVQQHQQSSSFNMYIFIAMIILGVFIIGANNGDQYQKINRDLMEIQYKQLEYQQIIIKKQKNKILNYKNQLKEIKKFDLRNSIQNEFNIKDQNKYNDNLISQITPLTYQLSPFIQDECLKSIISRNYTYQTIKYEVPINSIKSSEIRSVYNQMQVFSRDKQDQKDNILFCSLPKIYKKNHQMNFLSKFVDIIISGSQVMQIFGQQPNLWMNKLINFNGIYKINAEIKNIVKIQDSNCVL